MYVMFNPLFNFQLSQRSQRWKTANWGVFRIWGSFWGGFPICGFFMAFFTTCVFTFYTNIYHTFAYKLCDSPHYHKILMVFHTCCFTENSGYGKSMINLRRVNVKHHTFRKNSLISWLSFWVLTCRCVKTNRQIV